LAELLTHMLRACGREPSVTVRRRCGDSATKRGEQLLRHGVRGHSYCNGVLSARHDVMNIGGPWHHHGHRTWPEAFRKFCCGLRHFAHPATQEPRTVQMHNDRM